MKFARIAILSIAGCLAVSYGLALAGEPRAVWFWSVLGVAL